MSSCESDLPDGPCLFESEFKFGRAAACLLAVLGPTIFLDPPFRIAGASIRCIVGRRRCCFSVQAPLSGSTQSKLR